MPPLLHPPPVAAALLRSVEAAECRLAARLTALPTDALADADRWLSGHLAAPGLTLGGQRRLLWVLRLVQDERDLRARTARRGQDAECSKRGAALLQAAATLEEETRVILVPNPATAEVGR